MTHHPWEGHTWAGSEGGHYQALPALLMVSLGSHLNAAARLVRNHLSINTHPTQAGRPAGMRLPGDRQARGRDGIANSR